MIPEFNTTQRIRYSNYRYSIFNQCPKKDLCHFILVLKAEIKKMVLKCNASLEKNAKPKELLVPHEMVSERPWQAKPSDLICKDGLDFITKQNYLQSLF